MKYFHVKLNDIHTTIACRSKKRAAKILGVKESRLTEQPCPSWAEENVVYQRNLSNGDAEAVRDWGVWTS